MMNAAKCRVHGSDYIGVFCTATEELVFASNSMREKELEILSSTLKARVIPMRIGESDMIGIFSRANSNGIVLSNLIDEGEIHRMKMEKIGINIEVLHSNLNAIGCNILANDKIAIINDEYGQDDRKIIADALGVEVIAAKVGEFKTVGANNILTNSGLAINNRAQEREKEHFDNITKFDSIRTTANTGGLAIGLAVAANSKGVVAGEGTTGFELARIVEALEG